MAILIKSPQEIEKMREAGRLLRKVHDVLETMIRPGVSTMDLELAAEKKIRDMGAIPAFKGYHGYPAVLCTSVNDEVVHGIPNARHVLMEGDIIAIDCGVVVVGYYADAAVTHPVGRIKPVHRKLLDVTRAALDQAIRECVVGGRLGDISAAVQEICEAEGFGVVREFVGHGIGKAMHEEPQVPNYGQRGKGPKLKAGMVLAIEPMINAGGFEVKVLQDGWTAVTLDGSYSAHFEHTVAITEDGPRILTN